MTITGITMGAAVLAAPSAMADIHIYAVENANISHYGPTYVSESGPGNLNFSSVTGSPKASPKVGNESVEVGEIETEIKGGKGNVVVNEVEGAEQDAVAVAEQAAAEGAEQGAAEGAEQGAAEGAEQAKQEAQEQGAQQAAQEQGAERTVDGKDGHEKDGHEKDGHGKDGHGKDGHGKDGHGKDGHGKNGHDKNGHGENGEAEAAQWVKQSNIGHNGPTVVGEFGPGNLNFSSVTGSPKASPKVGNEAVAVGEIETELKGGKGNTVVNEVEGSEQDEIAAAGAA
ncbi:hypothetical protein E1200_21910 [Actinomadura sp. GC306]|uniref:hypothetical protein n=1 Tax=Actinomadura sp. GC306 TaxID=2530367 RepID=UPI00105030D0|nr:hypothetical protein [Actinomadura sp. GC306]TDC63621.1 hypothetical protein E1200_21910 [Actinomadura sp. GC306]